MCFIYVDNAVRKGLFLLPVLRKGMAQKMLDVRATRFRLTAPTPQAAVNDGVAPMEGSDIPPSMPSTTPRITKRIRKAGPSCEPGATRSRRNSCVRG